MTTPIRKTCAAVALFALIFLAGGASAHAAPPARVSRDATRVTDQLRAFERIDLDARDAIRKVRAGEPVLIATPTLAFDVRLVPNNIRSADCIVQVSRGNGVVERIDPGPVATFRGSVDGMPGAEARFTIDENGVRGLILTDDAWWFVEPEAGSLSKTGGRGPHVVYSNSDVVPAAFGQCGTTQAHFVQAEVARLDRTGKAQGGLPPLPPRVELATEADYDYFVIQGSARAVTNEIASIVNQVDGVYRKQLGVSFEIVFQNVWETRDDPYDETDAGERLGEFRTYWNSTQQSVRRDLTHFWTGAAIDGNTLGVAYVSVICASASASYGLSSYFQGEPGKFILTAHEIGHNFGARHPDQNDPPRTECDNTIMQSFVGTGFTFCKFSRTQIEDHLSTRSACLRNNREPVTAAGPDLFAGQGATVTLLGAGSTDADGDVLEYRWAQTGGQAVSLSGSTTSTPTFVAPSVASDTELAFTLTTTDGRGGTSQDDVVVTVVPGTLPHINLTSPAAGAVLKLGKKLKIRFAADAAITGTVLIELSRNGGSTFETIADGVSVTSGRWKWKSTGPKTKAAIVRITSTSDGRVQGFSQVFSIE
ncbi:MAG: hypothetical protein IT175_12105 [Acidobacteria bacterium]|nr:hypothetical protein [Acidobacteriota bacterium]